MDTRIARRYALALMDIGREKNSVETLANDLTTIGDTLHASTELRAMLHTPVIRPEVKRNVLKQLFQSHVSADLLLFLDLLLKKGRGALLGSVVTEFHQLLDEKNNTVAAVITSAVEMGDSAKKQIVERLEAMTKKTVRAAFATDASLRGGFIAKVGDTLIDASLAHQLENLREEFKKAASVHLN